MKKVFLFFCRKTLFIYIIFKLNFLNYVISRIKDTFICIYIYTLSAYSF